LSAMSVAHSALLTYNAALNRPAYQSTLHEDQYGVWNASLANDGSHETNTIKGDQARCTASLRETETNPWWAVDLGRPTTIYRVDLTNTGSRDYGLLVLFFILFWGIAKFSYCLVLFIMYVVDVSGITLSCFRVWRSCDDEIIQDYVEMLKEMDRDNG